MKPLIIPALSIERITLYTSKKNIRKEKCYKVSTQDFLLLLSLSLIVKMSKKKSEGVILWYRIYWYIK